MRLLFVLILAVSCSAQEKPDSPTLKASQMSPAERDAHLCQKFGCDKPVDSLKHAFIAKDMLPWEILYVASVSFDAGTTQHCISAKTCQESNPLLGKSAAQRYTVGGASVAAALFASAYLREHNHGTWAKAVLWVPTVIHIDLGIKTLREIRCSGIGCVRLQHEMPLEAARR